MIVQFQVPHQPLYFIFCYDATAKPKFPKVLCQYPFVIFLQSASII